MQTLFLTSLSLHLLGCKGAPATTTEDTAWEVAGPLTGLRVAAADDLTGDGQPELIVSAPDLQGDGAIYLLQSTGAALSLDDAVAILDGSEFGDIGEGLAVCGDLNGDGARDLAFGLPNGNGARGGVRIAWGPIADGAAGDATLIAGLEDDAQAGYAVSCGGDTNGDGFADLALAAPLVDGFGTAARGGQVWFYESHADGFDSVASVSTTFSDSELGRERSLTLDHDLNGDGLADAAIGASGIDRVHLLFGPHAGTYDVNTAGPGWYGEDDQRTGFALDSGDVTGDGHADLIVGAPDAERQSGSVWVLPGPFGDEGGAMRDLATQLLGDQTGAQAGHAVAVVGDVDADGLQDVAVGAPYASQSEPQEGKVYVVHGPGDTDSLSTAATLLSFGTRGHFGWSVHGGVDWDGDGLSDIVVGAPHQAMGDHTGAGAAYVFTAPFVGVTGISDAASSFSL